MNIEFEPQARKDLDYWKKADIIIIRKILALIADIEQSPYSGIGKPEPLKHALSGYWSRRITHEHRLVYKVTTTTIVILSCRYHYSS